MGACVAEEWRGCCAPFRRRLPQLHWNILLIHYTDRYGRSMGPRDKESRANNVIESFRSIRSAAKHSHTSEAVVILSFLGHSC